MDCRVAWFVNDPECRIRIPSAMYFDCFSYDPELNFAAWRIAEREFNRLEGPHRSVENFLLAGDMYVTGVLRSGWWRRRQKKKAMR